MSKKLAEGIESLVLDVKCGSGAFMKTETEARTLATGLKRIGQLAGKSVTAFITDMNEPLGRLIGNSVEVEECLAILRREDFRPGTLHSLSRMEFLDCEKLSVQLAGEMIHLCGVTRTREEGIARAQEVLESGGAYSAFQELIQQQGGALARLPTAQVLREVTSPAAGVMDMNCEAIGYAGIALKAGRAVASDILDPQAGVQILLRRGERVDRGQPVFRIFGGPQTQNLDEAERRLLAAMQIRDPGEYDGDELARLQQSMQNRKNGDLILGEV
jgi:pyrimidine-nucleoside phosphorylase